MAWRESVLGGEKGDAEGRVVAPSASGLPLDSMPPLEGSPRAKGLVDMGSGSRSRGKAWLGQWGMEGSASAQARAQQRPSVPSGPPKVLPFLIPQHLMLRGPRAMQAGGGRQWDAPLQCLWAM